MAAVSVKRSIWLVMWREEQATVGLPALRSGRPWDTKGTEEDRG